MVDHVVDVQLDVGKAPQFVFILAITADAIGDVFARSSFACITAVSGWKLGMIWVFGGLLFQV
jgi:hypothetical protein